MRTLRNKSETCKIPVWETNFNRGKWEWANWRDILIMFWMRRHHPDSLNLSCNCYIPCCLSGVSAVHQIQKPAVPSERPLHNQPIGCTSLISQLLVYTSSFSHTNPVSPSHPLQASVSGVSFLRLEKTCPLPPISLSALVPQLPSQAKYLIPRFTPSCSHSWQLLVLSTVLGDWWAMVNITLIRI